MHVEKITYTDFNDQSRTEEFMFNMSKVELMEMLADSPNGDLQKELVNMTLSRNPKELMSFMKNLILNAYGEKSDDGRRFIKVNDNGRRLGDIFAETAAFDELFMILSQDPDRANKFMLGVMPASLREEVQKEAATNPAIQKLTGGLGQGG